MVRDIPFILRGGLPDDMGHIGQTDRLRPKVEAYRNSQCVLAAPRETQNPPSAYGTATGIRHIIRCTGIRASSKMSPPFLLEPMSF